MFISKRAIGGVLPQLSGQLTRLMIARYAAQIQARTELVCGLKISPPLPPGFRGQAMKGWGGHTATSRGTEAKLEITPASRSEDNDPRLEFAAVIGWCGGERAQVRFSHTERLTWEVTSVKMSLGHWKVEGKEKSIVFSFKRNFRRVLWKILKLWSINKKESL